jgi:inward rectifier potassium channel
MRINKATNRGQLSGSQTDTGFGNTLGKGSRMIDNNGDINVERIGGQVNSLTLYQWLITTSWLHFWGVVLITYIVFNLFFASLYVIIGIDINGIENADTTSKRFLNAFFFSTQTFTTVGYGYLSPRGLLTNVIASLEAMVGLLTFAIATGLVYGRFSRPSANVEFSRNVVISPHHSGHQMLVFRVVNQRKNKLIELEAQVTLGLLRQENGNSKRDFFNLNLAVNKIYLFPLNWNIAHIIDETSPLYDKSVENIAQADAEIIITLKGFDDTFSQTIYIHRSYKWHEWVWNARFAPMFETSSNGQTTQLFLDKLHDYQTL